MKILSPPILLLAVLALLPAGSAASGGIVCGSTITTNTTLTSNLICPGVGLYVSGAVTVNFDGHTIFGLPGSTIGVQPDPGSTLKNGTIRGFAAGVFGTGLFNAPQFLVRMTLTDNGIGYEGADNAARFTNVNVVANRGPGIFVGGRDVGVTSSRITNNGGDGISVSGGNHATAVDSIISENKGWGFVTNSCTDATLLRNRFNNNNVYVGNGPCNAPSDVGGNIFRNSELIFEQAPDGWSPDLGGNKGNKCGLRSHIVCSPLP